MLNQGGGRIHLIGIGGIGMRALAQLLVQAGFEVSGSDARASRAMEALRQDGVQIHVGHDAKWVQGATQVVYSPAIPLRNPELGEARQNKLSILSRAEALAQLVKNRQPVYVAGSHGKTTTTAMLAFVLKHAGLDPGWMVGGSAVSLGGRGGHLGSGPFVAEACEAFGALHAWQPAHCIITNIDDEHVEHYGDSDGLRNAFAEMIARVQAGGAIAICGDDPGLLALAETSGRELTTYGMGEVNMLRADIQQATDRGSRFMVLGNGVSQGIVDLAVPGMHNIRNALGAIAIARSLGIPFYQIKQALHKFRAVDRRWQFLGEVNHIRVFDDFAHHPAEVEAVISVAHNCRHQGGKLVVAFEPQLHSRVLRLASRFADALAPADFIALLPVDAAGEPGTGGDEALTRALDAAGAAFACFATPEVAVAGLLDHLHPGDVLVTMGPRQAEALAGLVCHALQMRDSISSGPLSGVLSVSMGPKNMPLPQLLADRFFEHVRKLPQAPALSCGNETISYLELADRCRSIALRLAAVGVGPETVVAVRLNRAFDRIIAFMGITIAGGVYLPVDISIPRDRTEFMLVDARAHSVIADADASETELGNAVPNIAWDTLCCAPASVDGQPAAYSPSLTGRDAAYIIYTSGTTGTPKGVVVEHAALANFARAAECAFDIVPASRVSQVSASGFDVAVGDMVMSLYAGACLVCPDDATYRLGAQLGHFVRDARITHLSATPSALSTLPAHEYPALSHVIVNGEACPSDLAEQHSRVRCFFNAYGPAEATVLYTVKECHPGQPVTIGRAIDNTQVWILDSDMNPLVQGGVGEIWLTGAGLARGYLRRPELTDDRFRVLTTLAAEPLRAYRTGDLARMVPDGEIAHLGRADDQVKLRGHRIELGEIEATLRRHSGVQDAIVSLRKDKAGSDRLVAYVVGVDGEVPARDEMLGFLSDWLPEYMLPSAVVRIPSVPLSLNGKRDRSALPQPPRERSRNSPLKAAATVTEASLLALFRRELVMDCEIGIRDTFAELEVDSLRTVRLFLAIEKQFGVTLSAETMASADTAELLALQIDFAIKGRPQASPVSRSLSESIRMDQLRWVAEWTGARKESDSLIFMRNVAANGVPLFWCCQSDGEHRVLAEHIGKNRCVYGMRSGHRLFSYTEENVAALAALYVEEMTALQPQGGFMLGGNCQGATVAREIALQLRAFGREVEGLWLMEQGRFPAYDGRVALIFGAESYLNPYLGFKDPDRIFENAYGKSYTVDIIPGAHGQYFERPNIEHLARVLRQRLHDFENLQSPPRSNDRPHLSIGGSGIPTALVQDGFESGTAVCAPGAFSPAN